MMTDVEMSFWVMVVFMFLFFIAGLINWILDKKRAKKGDV